MKEFITLDFIPTRESILEALRLKPAQMNKVGAKIFSKIMDDVARHDPKLATGFNQFVDILSY